MDNNQTKEQLVQEILKVGQFLVDCCSRDILDCDVVAFVMQDLVNGYSAEEVIDSLQENEFLYIDEEDDE